MELADGRCERELNDFSTGRRFDVEMLAAPSGLPDREVLMDNLLSILEGEGGARRRAASVERRPNSYASTHPSEVVTCRFDDGPAASFFWKYDCTTARESYGHRHGVEYEATVYEKILGPIGANTPRSYGLANDEVSNQTWLVLENIDGHRLTAGTGVSPVDAAARWISRFHAVTESCVLSPETAFLNRYDEDYYLGWTSRTAQFTAHLHSQNPWLPVVCERFTDVLSLLLRPPLSVIHGEYYSQNILVRSGEICPVDWQSAAIAPGAVDLACLIDGWPDDVAERACAEYVRTRWPADQRAGFERTLETAMLYVHLRWLGEAPDSVAELGWRVARLWRLGRRLGLI